MEKLLFLKTNQIMENGENHFTEKRFPPHQTEPKLFLREKD